MHLVQLFPVRVAVAAAFILIGAMAPSFAGFIFAESALSSELGEAEQQEQQQQTPEIQPQPVRERVPIQELAPPQEPIDITVSEEPFPEILLREPGIHRDNIEEEPIQNTLDILDDAPPVQVVQESPKAEYIVQGRQTPIFQSFDIKSYYAQFEPEPQPQTEPEQQEVEPLIAMAQESMVEEIIYIEPEHQTDSHDMAKTAAPKPIRESMPESEIIYIDEDIHTGAMPPPSFHAQDDSELRDLKQRNESLSAQIQSMSADQRRMLALEQRVLELESNNHSLIQEIHAQRHAQLQVPKEMPPEMPPVQLPDIQPSSIPDQPVPLYQDEPGSRDWYAARGQSLRGVLQNWSDAESIRFFWNSEIDFFVPETLDVRAAYPSAVRALLEAYPTGELRPVGSLHVDAETGEQILLIQTTTQ